MSDGHNSKSMVPCPFPPAANPSIAAPIPHNEAKIPSPKPAALATLSRLQASRLVNTAAAYPPRINFRSPAGGKRSMDCEHIYRGLIRPEIAPTESNANAVDQRNRYSPHSSSHVVVLDFLRKD